MEDLISRAEAIDVMLMAIDDDWEPDYATDRMNELPSAQPEQTDCEYCHQDPDGYVRPIEKNSHAWLVRRGKVVKLRVRLKGEYRECDILFCPMCGRRLIDERFDQQTGGD